MRQSWFARHCFTAPPANGVVYGTVARLQQQRDRSRPFQGLILEGDFLEETSDE
jgi:hypothetical protein